MDGEPAEDRPAESLLADAARKARRAPSPATNPARAQLACARPSQTFSSLLPQTLPAPALELARPRPPFNTPM